MLEEEHYQTLQSIYNVILTNCECQVDVLRAGVILSLPKLKENNFHFTSKEKDILLLQLTILEILHQRPISEITSPVLNNLIAQTASEDNFQSLLQLCLSPDNLISFTSSKTLVSLLLKFTSQKNYFELLIIKALSNHGHEVNLLDTIRLAISRLSENTNPQMSELLEFIVGRLHFYWSELLKLFFEEGESKEFQLLNSFLLLWLKILKLHSKMQVDLKSKSWNIFYQPFNILTILQSSSYLSAGLAMDIINYMLSEKCNRTTMKKNCTSFETPIEFQVLTAIKNGLLLQIPFHNGFRAFGGIHVSNQPEQSEAASKYIKQYSGSKSLHRRVILMILKSIVVISKSDGDSCHTGDILQVVALLQEFLNLHIERHESLLHLYVDQDDSMVEVLKVLLDFYHSFSTRLKEPSMWNPHQLFYCFLNIISFDEALLLDYLISDETCFLYYFTYYIKFVLSDWNLFVRTHLQISKDVANLSPSPVTRKLLGSDKIKLSQTGKFPQNIWNNKLCTNRELTALDLTDAQTLGNEKQSDSATSAPSYSLHKNSDILSSSVTASINNVKLCDYDSSESSSEEEENLYLDKTMIVIMNLKSTITKLSKKGLFPYSAGPLLKLLQKCELLYKK